MALLFRRRGRIGVIELFGMIGPVVRSSVHYQLLDGLERNPRIRAVVLDIDSPGGAVTASEGLYAKVSRLRQKKPVVAYFGEVAASGGYYVAAHVDSIVAQPLTITGSIGVVSARLLAKELLERVGIRTEVLRTGPHADVFSPHRTLTDDERALMNRELDAFYESFVGLVADGRGRPVEEIEPLARGRVWLAADAHRLGLVDELGGMDLALDLLKARIDVAPRLRERLEPLVVTSYRLEPPPPAAYAWIDESILGTLKDLGLLLSEGNGVLYHVISVPRIR